MVLTTDQRSLFFFYRSESSDPWKQIYSCHSPNPDIYYTAIEILPISPSPHSLLLFLAGTDCQLYVASLSLPSPSLHPLCILSVSPFLRFHPRDPRTGRLLSASIATSRLRTTWIGGICWLRDKTGAAESTNSSADPPRSRAPSSVSPSIPSPSRFFCTPSSRYRRPSCPLSSPIPFSIATPAFFSPFSSSLPLSMPPFACSLPNPSMPRALFPPASRCSRI